MTNARLRARLYTACVIVLAIGVCAGTWIYRTAEDESDAAIEGIVTSKMYVRELQRFGGKAAVAFDDFNRWFAGLWHGKSLGITLACLCVLVSVVLFVIARRTHDDQG